MKLPHFGTPRLLQKLQWVMNPVGYMESHARRYPDLFQAEVVGFGNSLVFVSHPQAIQYILTHENKQLSVPGKVNGIVEPLVGEYSVIMLEGDRHRRQRQLLMPPFHGDRMKSYGEMIREIAVAVLSQVPTSQPFIARSVMAQISSQVMLQTVFGLDLNGENYHKLKKLMTLMLEVFNTPAASSLLFFKQLQVDLGRWSPWGYFLRMREKIDKLLYAEISNRRQQDLSDRSDILSLLISARDAEGEAMTDKELRDELLTLLFAGYETTASAMSWALYWVHAIPEVENRLREEMATLGDNPAPMDIFGLPYLTAVCNEVLRLYPVGMLTFPRRVEEPIDLLGYSLEVGTDLVGCIYLLHHREDLYPDSYQFKPERFLERQFSPYEFMPFGGGKRRCIGAVLAAYEMKLVLATILSGYDLKLEEKSPVKPQRRGVTLSPAGGIKMVKVGDRTKVERLLVNSVR
ncbi:cytochrome P450 [Laspinema olomoucense]|uniref:Cytochrome P450 n=1 Tax=Laspinema olomoucense D3b TaxID=2953688 RepID=A0ABT2N6U5_9CYAN|nr:cytochrome P450 [Laspinema sp. D3b]MCT7977430.1 cytochrome P450 [Laspinema sp. D3b]